MEYESKTYFVENEHDDVKGFTIIAVKDERYYIAEKWLASQNEEHSQSSDVWMDYWVSASELQSRIEDGKCDAKGKLTDDQFDKVCDNIDREVSAQKLSA